MATVSHYGPYVSSVASLAPQGEVGHYLGPFPADFKGTFVVGAHPHWYSFSRFPQALSVTAVHIVLTADGRHHLNFTVKNVHTKVVDAYVTWVSVIEP